MNKRSLGGLIVLNIVLLVALGLISFSPPAAEAQLAGRGGEYLMIAGEVPGRTHKFVYITDMRNSQMMTAIYDQGRRALVPLAVRDISADLDASPRR